MLLLFNLDSVGKIMKVAQISLPDELFERIERLAAEQGGPDYVSVNTDEVRGYDALLTDLLILGLDELEVGEAQFPNED